MRSSDPGSGIHDLLPRGTEEEPEDFDPLIEKIARKVVERRLEAPALIFLESVKPLAFLGNQLLVFLNPLVSLVVTSGDYYRFVRMIESRENVEKLLVAIETESAAEADRRREAKRRRRDGRRRSSKKHGSAIFGNRESGPDQRDGAATRTEETDDEPTGGPPAGDV